MDLGWAVEHMFGPNFEGCVIQGCDIESFDAAQKLVGLHPKVFASFGCHPKAAWSYNDQLEARIIAIIEACGPKVVAWGEFGLDYSHPYYGTVASNRRMQKEVFA